MARKGIDRMFLNYGVRTEDMALIEQTCLDSNIISTRPPLEDMSREPL